MWTCVKCREQVEPSFDVCWKCGTSKEGEEDPSFGKGKLLDSPAGPATPARTIDCLRCRTRMICAGVRQFHEGAKWGLLGNLGELFVNREQFEIHLCPACGKVEFFAPGPLP